MAFVSDFWVQDDIAHVQNDRVAEMWLVEE
jgi:hypothetical protein